jgi:hypothetical protein
LPKIDPKKSPIGFPDWARAGSMASDGASTKAPTNKTRGDMPRAFPATGLAGDNSIAAFGYVLTLCKILDRGKKTLQLPPNGFLHCTCPLSGVKQT